MIEKLMQVAEEDVKFVRARMLWDATANWERANPILLKGEMGFELKSDGSIAIKIGDGMTAWKLLKYTTKTMAELDAERNSLQSQIDNIVVAATDEGGNASTEVAQSRVDIYGNNHPTLKSRLDADQKALNTAVENMKEDYETAIGEVTADFETAIGNVTKDLNNFKSATNTNLKNLPVEKLGLTIVSGKLCAVYTE